MRLHRRGERRRNPISDESQPVNRLIRESKLAQRSFVWSALLNNQWMTGQDVRVDRGASAMWSFGCRDESLNR
jgi:hypothetical protein